MVFIQLDFSMREHEFYKEDYVLVSGNFVDCIYLLDVHEYVFGVEHVLIH